MFTTLIKRIILYLIILTALRFILNLNGRTVYDRVIIELTNYGSLLFIFGPYITFGWDSLRSGKSSTPDSTIIWRALGVVLWVAAGLTLIAVIV